MRLLVTGGAGFVGASLARELLRRGHEVTLIDDLSVGSVDRVPDGARLIEADLRDPDATRAALRESRPDAVAHLAAAHFIPWCLAHPEETRERNVDGTRHLIESLGGARLVFASTGDVYAPSEEPRSEGDPAGPINVYGRTKLEGERLALEAGGRVARLFNVYGPGETNAHVLAEVLGQLAEGDELRLGNTSAVRDWVFLHDAVAALAELLEVELPGTTRTVNVASGTACSVDDLIELLRALTGRSLQISRDPDRMRPVDRPVLRADPSLLRSLRPELPATPLPDGLAATLRAEGLL